MQYKLTDTGKDLVREANLDEVFPNIEMYYLTNPLKYNKFYLTSFSHMVDWNDIKELIREHRIYVKTTFDKVTAKSSGGISGGNSTFNKQEAGRSNGRDNNNGQRRFDYGEL